MSTQTEKQRVRFQYTLARFTLLRIIELLIQIPKVRNEEFDSLVENAIENAKQAWEIAERESKE